MRRVRNLALVKRIAIVLVALLLGLCAPVVATAQLGPTNVPPALTTPDEQVDSTPFERDTGLSTRQLVLIFGAAILVIGLIAWVIMRDARSAAPDAGRGHHGGGVSAAGSGGGAKAKSAREREREKQRKRNKAKAQRNQRKKNRPR
jgi:hypothetical protein